MASKWCFRNFRKTLLKSQKNEEIQVTNVFINGFIQNEGEKMLLQKCPKPFYNDCCRFLLKTVTKCCFRNFPNSFYNDCCRFLLKTVAKCCFRNFPLFCKLRVVPDFSQWRSKDTASEISETIFTIKDVPDFS